MIDDSAVLETDRTTANLTAGVSSDRSAVLEEPPSGMRRDRSWIPERFELWWIRLQRRGRSSRRRNFPQRWPRPVMQIFNYTGKRALNMTDSQGNLNVIKNVLVSVRDQADNLLSINGAVAPAFPVQEILGDSALREGETIQAFYRRADGSWIALPVVIKNGAIAISIPSFGDYANVVFVIVQGTSMETIPGEAMTSPSYLTFIAG